MGIREKKCIEISSTDELIELLKLCDENTFVTVTIETEGDAYEWQGSPVHSQ